MSFPDVRQVAGGRPRAARKEQEAPPSLGGEGRGEERPEAVPDGEDPVNEDLDRGRGGADLVENLVELVRHEAVGGPFGEEDCAGVSVSEWSLPFNWMIGGWGKDGKGKETYKLTQR